MWPQSFSRDRRKTRSRVSSGVRRWPPLPLGLGLVPADAGSYRPTHRRYVE